MYNFIFSFKTFGAIVATRWRNFLLLKARLFCLEIFLNPQWALLKNWGAKLLLINLDAKSLPQVHIYFKQELKKQATNFRA